MEDDELDLQSLEVHVLEGEEAARFARWVRHCEIKSEQGRRRRERMRANGQVEQLTIEEIARRDGWRCWICLFPVMHDAVHPDPFSPSKDHVRPIALGGAHTRGNVRLAHLVCNQDRWSGKINPRMVALRRRQWVDRYNA